MCTSPKSGTRGLERLPPLKYYSVLKQESGFTLELNAAKITDYIKNCSNKSCWELNFVQKSQQANISISPRSGIAGDFYVSNIILYWNGKVGSLQGPTLPEIRIKKVQIKVFEH